MRGGENRNTYQYVLELRNWKKTCQMDRESLMETQGLQKHHYDHKSMDKRCHVGQKALVLLPMEHNKLTLWWKGPYTVQEASSSSTSAMLRSSPFAKITVMVAACSFSWYRVSRLV